MNTSYEEFLDRYKEVIDKKDFGNEEFQAFYGEEVWNKLLDDLQRIGVNPLEYLDRIPSGFFSNTNLKNVNIPVNIKFFEAYPFVDDRDKGDKLPRSITYEGNIDQWCQIDSSSRAVVGDSSPFYDNEDMVLYIGNTPLTEASINTTIVGGCSFFQYNHLKKVTFLNKVRDIQPWAFYGCLGLKSVIAEEGLLRIDSKAFSSCTNLEQVVLPSSLQEIGRLAFEDCSKLSSITYKGTKEQWSKVKRGDAWVMHTLIKVIHCKDGDLNYGL